MRIGTTPKHEFTLPFDTSVASKIQITYVQGDSIVLQKTTPDCVLDGCVVTVRLTQEETFLFDQSKHVQIQIRILTAGGDALASDIMRASALRCLDQEVLA